MRGRPEFLNESWLVVCSIDIAGNSIVLFTNHSSESFPSIYSSIILLPAYNKFIFPNVWLGSSQKLPGLLHSPSCATWAIRYSLTTGVRDPICNPLSQCLMTLASAFDVPHHFSHNCRAAHLLLRLSLLVPICRPFKLLSSEPHWLRPHPRNDLRRKTLDRGCTVSLEITIFWQVLSPLILCLLRQLSSDSQLSGPYPLAAV